METLKSESKKRVLPSWMTSQVTERRVVPVKTPKRRRMAAGSAAAGTPAMKTVYCMNEAEMVDVALGILIECRKQEKPREQSPLADADKLELSPICSVSPHTSSPGSSSEEEDGGKDRAARGLSPSQGPGTSSSTCRSPREAEEEDVLKYVREIFFS
ncbi:Modulator of retrovirus infection [Sciurus carolinensis]|uniref:Modulator of retrovirus infection n=1 Tax=Sciurus carolinensis TaxID=30640 RepID=A0AA41NBB2_SCICA|nr:cell cycle regulator of non-homologous end joining [Sciurus carolinensis]XP_047416455.1 cell cycle regulator of non-homologous end joining [Sciurus carolinensis]MBZ3887209.1 Modulator of retrovirus infection [Sciurus carolinensis]